MKYVITIFAKHVRVDMFADFYLRNVSSLEAPAKFVHEIIKYRTVQFPELKS